MKVLVVDDEPDIVMLLEQFLSGRDREIVTAANGREALEQFARARPDLVVLDVQMPELDGWQTLQRLRERSDVPVIMLTARGEALDKTRGLLSGADDYITKPFDFGELEARVTAVMRRVQAKSKKPVLKVGALVVDDAVKEVRIGGKPAQLSPLEYELVKLLASQPGEVFSPEEIIREVWRDKPMVTATDVAKYVNLVRKKIEADPKNPALLLNVRGFGYKLGAD